MIKKIYKYKLISIFIVSLLIMTACGNDSNDKNSAKNDVLLDNIFADLSGDSSSNEKETSQTTPNINTDSNVNAGENTESDTDDKEELIGSNVGETPMSEEELAIAHAKYQEYLEPADDEIDFMFASDYKFLNFIKTYKCYDSCSYETILGIKNKISIDDIKAVLKTNNKINQEYKDFIIQYATDWLSLYPESDFRLFYHNLKTLEIKVCTENEMMLNTLTTGAAACYLKNENTICLLEGTDFSRDSDNYIILAHELTHCARSAIFKNGEGYEIFVDFHEKYNMGTYAEEGIITNIAYEMQGLGNRADFYPFQSSCYRIIMDCTGYDGDDFMNHSVNYLTKVMDDYMGDEQYAYYIVALIDSISIKKYESYKTVDFTNYQDLYDYMTKMYMKKYLKADMSSEEAEQVFNDFCDNIMHNFETMNRKYAITRDSFEPAFKQCKEELGIK